MLFGLLDRTLLPSIPRIIFILSINVAALMDIPDKYQREIAMSKNLNIPLLMDKVPDSKR